jgi:hypothetical protein
VDLNDYANNAEQMESLASNWESACKALMDLHEKLESVARRMYGQKSEAVAHHRRQREYWAQECGQAGYAKGQAQEDYRNAMEGLGFVLAEDGHTWNFAEDM